MLVPSLDALNEQTQITTHNTHIMNHNSSVPRLRFQLVEKILNKDENRLARFA